MTTNLKELSTNAARQVHDLMDGAFLCNGGANDYIQVEIPELDDVDTGYIIAYVPTLEEGEHAKWRVDNGAYTMSFEHETFDAFTPPQEVEAWIGECIQNVISA